MKLNNSVEVSGLITVGCSPFVDFISVLLYVEKANMHQHSHTAGAHSALLITGGLQLILLINYSQQGIPD